MFVWTFLVFVFIAVASPTPARLRSLEADTEFDVMNEWIQIQKSRRSNIVKMNPHNNDEEVPESFDAREAWPNCDSIKQIYDQGHSETGWAVATAATISDRVCIHSNQTKQVTLSAEDLITCSVQYGFYGGVVDDALEYWVKSGIATGGIYNSSNGCKPYSLPPCVHHSNFTGRPACDAVPEPPYLTTCVKTCSDPSISYEDSLIFGQEIAAFDNEKQIQLEILKNGPVIATLLLSYDFPSYTGGIYVEKDYGWLDAHSVRIIGWGVENDVKYWLVANSWNTDWGEDGYIRMIRGQDAELIEDFCYAAIPILS